MVKQYFKFIKDLGKESEKEESLGTGLLGEKMIITAYKKMPLKDLLKLRFIMNKIIKEKKEYIRIQNAKNNPDNNIDNNSNDSP